MSDDQLCWYLKQTDLFDGAEDRELAALAATVREQWVRRREVLQWPPDGDGVFIVKTGRVKLVQATPDGRRVTIDILEPGDLFGELSGDGGNSHGEAVAEALEDALICRLSRAQFETLLRLKPDLALRVVEVVDQRRSRVETRLRDVMLYDVPTRLARLLLQLGEQHGIMTRDGIRLDLRLTHEELASLIGSTRETVSAILSEFRTRGLVRYQPREPMVLSVAPLRAQAGLDT